MLKLAIDNALHRNSLSGASHRRLVVYLFCAFLLRRSIDAYPRRVAKLWSSGRRENRWAGSLLPWVFTELRRPW